VIFSQVPIPSTSNVLPDVRLPVPKAPAAPNPNAIIGAYNPRQSVAEQNKAIIAEADEFIRQQQAHKKYVQSLIDDAFTTNTPQIAYSIPLARQPGKEAFYNALNELRAMIQDTTPVDIIRATNLVENAFDPTIPDGYLEQYIKQVADHISRKIDQEGFDPSDNLAKNMMIFRYMTDTLTVDYEGIEKPVVTYPKTYDFDDFWGKRDWSKMFVSKLMRDGSGQCHSLPLLYLMIAQEIGADASLAFAPNHSYIKFKNARGNWQSLELTVGGLSSENFIVQSGFVKSEAIRNKIYLDAISDRQLIAQSINDLVSGYIRKYGYDDSNFIKAAFKAVYEVFPNSITAHQINANYYTAQLQYVVSQYQQYGFSKEQFDQDKQAQFLLSQMNGAFKYIDNLGFAPMPEDAYITWLESVEELAKGQYSKVKMEELNSQIKQ